MTRDDIIRIARDASLFDDDQEPLIEHLERFFHMAQAEEREAILKICEENDTVHSCTAAIKARSWGISE